MNVIATHAGTVPGALMESTGNIMGFNIFHLGLTIDMLFLYFMPSVGINIPNRKSTDNNSFLEKIVHDYCVICFVLLSYYELLLK